MSCIGATHAHRQWPVRHGIDCAEAHVGCSETEGLKKKPVDTFKQLGISEAAAARKD